MDRISQIELFAAVVEEGTFTAAAEREDVSKSHVSTQISDLEERLGVRLLQRTTRSVDPTPEGEAYYERIRGVLDELEEADRALRQARTEPMGTLRVSAPVDLGTNYLGPIVGDYLATYDEVSIDIDLNDRKVDLVDEGYDLAVRVGRLEDSSLIVRRLADVEGCVCASPDYLEHHGTPEHPEELSEHDCVVYRYLPDEQTWTFTAPEEVEVDIDGPIEANNGSILADVAARGGGIAMAPSFIVADLLRAGRLERILTDWELPSGAIWALYPHRRHLSAKVRTFIDLLKERLESPPWHP
jgi:DNA-binding transcriptional LysR family regulator